MATKKNTILGGDLHKILAEYAVNKLKAMGVENISFEVDVGKTKRSFVDVLGMKDGERIGVECIMQVQPKGIAKRIPNLNVDKLIFCVPNNREAKKLEEFGKTVWVSGTPFPRTVTITLSEDVEKDLRDRLWKYGDMSRIVENALIEYLRKMKCPGCGRNVDIEIYEKHRECRFCGLIVNPVGEKNSNNLI